MSERTNDFNWPRAVFLTMLAMAIGLLVALALLYLPRDDGGGDPPTWTPSPTASVTPTATSTVTATFTPQPPTPTPTSTSTSAPVPPTGTPVPPTATSVPTDTPAPPTWTAGPTPMSVPPTPTVVVVLPTTGGDGLPSSLTLLLTPAGLGAAVLVITGLLKRIKGPLGDKIRQNARLASVIVAVVLVLGVALIQHLGYTEQAESVYQLVMLVLGWFLSQGFYHVGKDKSRASQEA